MANIDNKKTKDVFIFLRAHHDHFLVLLADRWERSVAKTLEILIERQVRSFSQALDIVAGSPEKTRRHVTISASHLAFLDKLAGRSGLSRSDVIRRLVEDAMTKDKPIS